MFKEFFDYGRMILQMVVWALAYIPIGSVLLIPIKLAFCPPGFQWTEYSTAVYTWTSWVVGFSVYQAFIIRKEE